MMAMADDTDNLLGVWGDTLTIRYRKTVSYGGFSENSVVWDTRGTALGMIQPASANTMRAEQGLKVVSTHEIFLPNGTTIVEGDRVRPSTWLAGNDEYEVTGVDNFAPSHVLARARKVKGHGG